MWAGAQGSRRTLELRLPVTSCDPTLRPRGIYKGFVGTLGGTLKGTLKEARKGALTRTLRGACLQTEVFAIGSGTLPALLHTARSGMIVVVVVVVTIAIAVAVALAIAII